MGQNNFEKSVQQKLDELKIPPSDSVWTDIEKHIGKKDKDGKLIIIFFFLTVILLSGAYWLFNSTKNNVSQSHQISQLKKDNKPTNNEDPSFRESEIISGNNFSNTDSASVPRGKAKGFNIDSQNKIEIRSKKKQMKFRDDFTRRLNKNYSKDTNNEDSEIALNNVEKLIEKTTDIAEIENKNESKNIASNFQNQINTDSFLIQLKSEKVIQKLIAKNAYFQKRDSKEHTERWNFGITFSGGSSLIGSSILERNYPMDMNASLPSGGILYGGNPSYYYSPSPLKNSTAFVAGVLVEKNLSAKSKITVGISYKYYSLKNKVGNKIDSIFFGSLQYFPINYFNNSTSRSHSYRNNFHYLEVPVSIKIQLNKNKKLPLFWNGGLNISELISSNALQFKPNPGVYYNDNSLFNKTQFGLHTGLSLTLFSRKKMPFTFGPYFYYNATSLSDKGLYDGKNFSFVGIQTEILFRKK